MFDMQRTVHLEMWKVKQNIIRIEWTILKCFSENSENCNTVQISENSKRLML